MLGKGILPDPWREQLPEGALASLLGTLLFIVCAHKYFEDLVLLHVSGGKKETFISPTRLSILIKIRR